MNTETSTGRQENFARLLQSNKEKIAEQRARKAGKQAYILFQKQCDENMKLHGLPTGSQNETFA